MKKSVIACLLLAVTVLSAGCGSQKKADPIESTHDETDIEDETVEISSDDGTSDVETSSSNVNHGYSITVRTEPDPKEILRSDEVLLPKMNLIHFQRLLPPLTIRAHIFGMTSLYFITTFLLKVLNSRLSPLMTEP